MCVSYAHFNFFPYKFQLNESAKALCLYCTDSKDTNICVKVIQWDRLWYDFPVFTVSHYGEQAVSFKMVDLPKSLHLVFARRSSTDSGKHLVLAHSSSTDSGCLFPAAGTLTRATAGSDQFSVWNVNEMYRVKVVSAKNTNVAENHKVTAQDHGT